MKSMKLLCFALTAMICGSCSGPVLESLWQGKNIKVDGSLQEWKTPLRYYDDKSNLQFTVANDSVNLYLCIRATEQSNQIKILRSGMQIWIDTAGKKKEQTVLIFPIAAKEFKRPSFGDSARSKQFKKPDQKMRKARFDMGNSEMELKGFKSPIGGITPLQNEFGIKAALDWDDVGNMNYEATIPFRTFYRNELTSADSNRVLGITINIPELTAPGLSGRGGGPEGGHGGPGGGGFDRGGHMDGGGNFGGGQSWSETMSEATKIYMRVKLASRH